MPFSAVLGHARPLALLTGSIARGTMPPSLLFTGPDGVGKKLVALAVAEALNCLNPVCATADVAPAGVAPPSVPADACGSCPACRRIAKGTHPDVLVIEPPETGSTRIDQVRQAIAATAYRPFEGRRRAVILDDADRLGDDAESALLKTLEEPPPGTVFILVSARPDTLRATIRSRCSQLRFGRLAAGDVARYLVERHGCETGEAHAIAAVSGGSPGRALESGSRAYRDARAAALAALQTAGEASNAKLRLAASARLLAGKSSPAAEREELSARLTMLTSLLRDLALAASGGPAGQLANGDLAGELRSLAPAFGAARATRAFAAADRALAALRRNASPKVVGAWVAVNI